jgi:hypothetical protein
LAQDPTVPSAQILERLGGEQPRAVALPATQERQAPLELKLKAIVMSDSDHGTALIEVEGRRIRLRLSRLEAGLDPVVIQGSTYRVQNFSAHSVTLESNGQILIGQ